ncbi:MAG: type II toxin-antitoxin system HicB family antitoxin [Fimbriimonadales bacterium]
MREFTVLVEQDEEGYDIAEVLELKGCYTQARSLDELMERIREAILLHIEGNETPLASPRWVGVQRIAV